MGRARADVLFDLLVVHRSPNVTLTGSAAVGVMTQRPVFWLETQKDTLEVES